MFSGLLIRSRDRADIVMDRPHPTAIATSRQVVATRLQAHFDDWLALPLWQHALAILLLGLALGVRWWPRVTTSALINDELIYFAAFRNVVEGISPFERSGYLSFSLLAHVGGWGLATFGQEATLAALRAANLIGVSTCVWCSLAWSGWSFGRRWCFS